MRFEKLKAGMIPWLFGCGKAVVEKAPELVEKAAPAIGAAATAALAPAALPIAILAPPILEQIGKRYEDQAQADALAELYRESLRHAVEDCRKSLEDDSRITEDDRALLALWCDGLKVPTKDDPFWARMLDEDLPAATVRLISIDLGETRSYWPLLRAQLARWSDWFRYRRNHGKEAIGIAVPRQPLALSGYLEGYLAANLPALLTEKFRPEISDGKQAFAEAVLATLSQLSQQVSPLDPLKPITEFPTARNATREIQLLDARFRAVPYIGREADLETLWNWLTGPAPMSFQVIVGRGGSGKTRIAYRLLELIEERMPFTWHAGVLEPQRFADNLANERFRRWRGRRPTLIVIDYAASCSERLQQNVVPELSSSCATADPNGPPLRFLLLERGADEREGWYASLLRAAASAKPDLFPNAPLRLAALDGGQRLELLNAVLAALHHFDNRGQPAPMPADVSLLPRLSAARMEDPLVLAMAAMVAHERRNLDALDLDRIDLAREVAAHEYRRLERLAHAMSKTEFLPVHLAAYITMTGRLEEKELHAACTEEKAAIERDSAWSVQDLCTTLLTPALPSIEARAAEPITPDIVGEAFVLDVLQQPGHDANGTVVRAAARKPGPVTRTLVRLIQDFGPQHEKVRPEDEKNQKWALELLTDLLQSKTGSLRDEDFWEIHAALPLDTTVMLEAADHFYRAVAQGVESPAIRLEALEAYSIYESKLGNRAKALQVMQELVIPMRRKLAGANRERFLPSLAMSLNNQATLQSEMGQRAAALESIAEAVQHYRELVASNRDAFLPDLAMSLNNQATLQSEMGQRAAALESIGEAVKIRRELVAANRDAFLPDLALSLGAFGSVLTAAEEPSAAVEKFAEGIRLISPLALELPQAHFRLAYQLATRYVQAAAAAGIPVDAELTWPIEMAKRAQQGRSGSDEEEH